MKNLNPLQLTEEINNRLLEYARLIHTYNKTTNITGLKDIESIYNELIIGSIRPLMHIDVPRGTCFVDIGTGAGIPGIPLLVFFKGNIKAVLIDSNNKKIKFLLNVIDELNIQDSAMVIEGRAEEMARNTQFRDTFDFAVARAFAYPFMALEYGLPFVKPGGWLYIYYKVNVYNDISYDNETLPGNACIIATRDATMLNNATSTTTVDLSVMIQDLQKHANVLGGHMVAREEAIRLKVFEGLLFIKDGPTPQNYPRKHNVVKREVEKLRDMRA